jgi:PPOX class probable F420-dependent enzyme
MSQMTAPEIKTYLKEARIADLATLRSDGSPHIAPVWYQYRTGALYIMARQDSVKVRNIRRDARVAVSIPKPDLPYQYVVIEGTATITDHEIAKMILEISIHYRGKENGEIFANELLSEGAMVVIEIAPTRTLTWDAD